MTTSHTAPKKTKGQALKDSTRKRNGRIVAEFKRRYTDQPRPRKYTKEYIISQLADEFYLSMSTVEDIINYNKPAQAAA